MARVIFKSGCSPATDPATAPRSPKRAETAQPDTGITLLAISGIVGSALLLFAVGCTIYNSWS